MIKKDVLSEKSFDFAVKILRLTERLRANKEYIVSTQLGKSGTSIGANVREARFAQGKKILFPSWKSLQKKPAKPVIG